MYTKEHCTPADVFIENAVLLCSICSDAGPLLDLPSPPRLRELHIQTVPLHGNAFFVSDLTLESSPHPLKSSISRDTGHKSHVSEVYWAVRRHHLRRLYEAQLLAFAHGKCTVDHAWLSLKSYICKPI